MKTTELSINKLLDIIRSPQANDFDRWVALAHILEQFMESQGVDLDYTEDGEVEKPTRIEIGAKFMNVMVWCAGIGLGLLLSISIFLVVFVFMVCWSANARCRRGGLYPYRLRDASYSVRQVALHRANSLRSRR